ncbi:hypothetical protein D3C72_1962250 [compost metagenome]
MGKVVSGTFLLIGELMDRVVRIRVERAGGDKQAAWIAVVTHAIRQRGIARQYFLLGRQLFVQHELSAPDIDLLAKIAERIVEQRFFIRPETAQFIQRIIDAFGDHLKRGAGDPLYLK